MQNRIAETEPARWRRGGPVARADGTNARVWIVSADHGVAVVGDRRRLRRHPRLR